MSIMTRDEAREYVKQHISCKEYLTESPDGSKNKYICPYCGSGTGKDGTGALHLYEDNAYRCFSCNQRGDVINLYERANNVDFNTALKKLSDRCGIEIEGSSYYAGNNAREYTRDELQAAATNAHQETTTPDTNSAPAATEEQIDLRGYFKECRERIYHPEAQAYLEQRGISIETAYSCGIGYDPYADPAETNIHTKRIIIPNGKAQYTARSIDPKVNKKFKALNNKGHGVGIFNKPILKDKDKDVIFVTEGAFDALSIIEVGGNAIALNSAGNYKKLLEILENEPTAATIAISLDKDDTGRRDAKELREGLQKLNISCMDVDVCGAYKDPNEYLTADRKAFERAVNAACIKCGAADSVSGYIKQFFDEDIEKNKHTISTGFDSVNNSLDSKSGGLRTGLYVIAAISSLGKTTFAAQMADNIAIKGDGEKQGHDVIYFSLEQSRLELVSKAVSRTAYNSNPNTHLNALNVRYNRNTPEVQNALNTYTTLIGNRLSIIEGNFNCTVSYISDYVRNYIKRKGVRPVVFIDYLQVLQPDKEDRRAQSAKETIDSTVIELKRMSRELDIPVVVISSVNRANYLTPIDFESLKESGGIEYTADVIYGLQLQCLNDNTFTGDNKNITERRKAIKDAKAASPRKIELCCLKNRFGISSFSCYFNYYPEHDVYIDTEIPDKRKDVKKAW